MVDEPTSADASILNERLLAAVRVLDGRTYAVVDGAQFEDLPHDLAMAGLNYRSLYLGAPDPGLLRASPFLIDPYLAPPPNVEGFETNETELADRLRGAGHDPDALTEEGIALSATFVSEQFTAWVAEQEARPAPDPMAQFAKLFDLVGDCPAMVLWSGRMEAAELFKHLRSLNRAIAPMDEEDIERDEDGQPVGPVVKPYLFRHYDGRVVAEFLPVLDREQFRRFFGPASRLTFLAPGYENDAGDPLRMAELPDELRAVPMPSGMLRLTQDQIAAVEERKLRSMWRGFMNEILPRAPQTETPFSDEELSAMAWNAMLVARDYGVESEEAFEAFVLMELISRGAATRSERLRKTMQADDPSFGTPDERILKFKERFDARIRRDFGGQ